MAQKVKNPSTKASETPGENRGQQKREHAKNGRNVLETAQHFRSK